MEIIEAERFSVRDCPSKMQNKKKGWGVENYLKCGKKAVFHALGKNTRAELAFNLLQRKFNWIFMLFLENVFTNQ